MEVPTKRKESTVEMGGVREGRGDGGAVDYPEVYDHLHCLLSIELQIIAATPGHQLTHLLPVGIISRDMTSMYIFKREREKNPSSFILCWRLFFSCSGLLTEAREPEGSSLYSCCSYPLLELHK